MARGHPRPIKGATAATIGGVDCVVVGRSYGRVLQPVSNKISSPRVKLSAGMHVLVYWLGRSRRAAALVFTSRSATPAPSTTAFQPSEVKSAGCAAIDLFASETPANM